VTTQLYRPGAGPSSLRSMPSTLGGTAIPINRILTSEDPGASARWRVSD